MATGLSMRKTTWAAAALAAVALAYGCAPSSHAGYERARVIDGDTLALGSRHVRLWGIDAPELAQTCANQFGLRYHCGAEARDWLAAFLSDQLVRCETKKTDSYGRDIATCQTTNGVDIARSIVLAGYAVAYTRYTDRYKADEIHARSAKTGIWRGQFTPPEQYRHPAGV